MRLYPAGWKGVRAGLGFENSRKRRKRDRYQNRSHVTAIEGLEPRQLLAGNLITNGSFESPAVTHSSGWDIYSTIPGWTLEAGPSFELQTNSLGLATAPDGNQYIELDADVNGHVPPDPPNEQGSSTISQTVTTQSGNGYVLRFYFTARPNTSASDNIVGVKVIDDATSQVIVDEQRQGDAGWKLHEFYFQAVGSSTTIQFQDLGTSNTLGSFLDNVSVYGTSPGDDYITVSVNDSTVAEPQATSNNGQAAPLKTFAHFYVTITEPQSEDLTFSYSTENGTAENPADYDENSGTVTIPADQTQASEPIVIAINGDDIEEGVEYYRVNVKGINNEGFAQGTGYILDYPLTSKNEVKCECKCICSTEEITVDNLYAMVEVVVELGVAQAALVFRSYENPHPIMEADFMFPPGKGASSIDATLTFGGLEGGAVTYNTAGVAEGESMRLALQADATTLESGHYNYDIDVRSEGANGPYRHIFEGSHEVFNRTESPAGNRWDIEGTSRLIEGSSESGKMLDRYDGSAGWFPLDDEGAYATPYGSYSQLVPNPDGTFTLTYPSGDRDEFDNIGRLTARIDSNGNETTYEYEDKDGDGIPVELTLITDPFGRQTHYDYTAGLLSSVTDYAGRATVIQHTGNRLTRIIKPDPDGPGPETSPELNFEYSPEGLLTAVVDARGNRTEIDQGLGTHLRFESATNADGTTWSLDGINVQGWAAPGAPGTAILSSDVRAKFTNERGFETITTTDRFGLVTSRFDALENFYRWDRDKNGRLLKYVEPDPDGEPGPLDVLETVYERNAVGNPTKITFADGSFVQFEYEPNFNRVTKFTDEIGRVTLFDIDPANGNVLAETQVFGNEVDSDPGSIETDDVTWTYTYTDGTGDLPAGLLLTETDPRGYITAYVYEDDPQAIDFGWIESITFATGHPTDEATVEFEYDAAGNVTAYIDELGHRTDYEYDSLDRLTKAIEPLAEHVLADGTTGIFRAETSYEYDGEDNLTRVIDGLGNVTDYEYDVRNRLEKIIEPDPDGDGPAGSPTTTLNYDGTSNLTSVTDPIGRTTTYVYDELDRLIETISPNPTPEDAVVVDNGDAGYSDQGPWNSLPTGYGDDVRYISVGTASDVATWTVSGLIDGLQYEVFATWPAAPLNTTDAVYTVFQGGVVEATATVDQQVDLSDQEQAPLARQLGGAYWQSLGTIMLTGDSLTVELSGEADDTVMADAILVTAAAPRVETEYDNVGNVTSETDGLGNTTEYVYDERHRLIKIIEEDPVTQGGQNNPEWTLIYDLASQLESITDPLGRVTNYEYDNLGRLTREILPKIEPDDAEEDRPEINYVYDKSSNLTAVIDPEGNRTDYEYDARDRLTKRTDADPGDGSHGRPETQYVLDAASRLEKVVDPLGRETTFAYDDVDRLVQQHNPDPLTGLPSAGSPIMTYGYDAVGNEREMVDALQNRTQYVYDGLYRLVQQIDEMPDTPAASTAIIIDNDDAGYSEISGTWTYFNNQGFEGDLSAAPTGSGGAVAEYTFTGLAAGYYQVAITWVEHVNRATDSPFTILDDDTALITIDVNQELVPRADYLESGTRFEKLGVPVPISSGTLKLQLSNNANGWVIADAVRVDRVGAAPVGVEVIDNDDAGYVEVSGTWTDQNNQGFDGDVSFAAAGSGEAVAEYTFTGLAAGYYQVSATWTKHSNRAKNTPFTILDDGTELTTITVNQELAPLPHAVESGVNFQNLGGLVAISSGKLVVRITNDAEEFVIADAIRIEQADPPPAGIAVIDNENPGYQELSGSWTDFDKQGFEGDVSFAAAGSGGAVAEYTFTGLTPGYYQVSATWTEYSNRATNAPFTILDGTTSLVTVDVNQKLEPIADAVYAGRKFQHLGGPVAISSGSLVVQLTNDANGFVIADAIHLEIVRPSGEGVTVIDDDDAGYDQVSGSWSSLGNSGFNGDFDFAAAGSGEAVVEYSFTGLAAGYYQVSITWVKDTNRATDAPFTILDGSAELSWSSVNQKLAPEADVVAGGIDFMHLGNPLSISSGTLVVRLTNDANGYVIADAVRIDRIEDPPVTFFTYDAAGQLLTTTDPLGRTWTYDYDQLGRVMQETSPDPDANPATNNSPLTLYRYDTASNLIARSDALGNTVRYGYDNLYRLTGETDENGDPTIFTFDAVGNMTSLLDPVGNTTTWFYDGLDRVTEERNQIGDSRLFGYDLVGNLLEKTDRNGRVTQYDYDGLYRLKAERWLDGQQQTIHTMGYSYDAASRLLTAGDSNATYSYGYDELDRTTSVTQSIAGLVPTVGLAQAFDLMNNRTQVAAVIGGVADFVTDYRYDNLYRLTGVEQASSVLPGGNAVAEKAIDLSYDVAGQLVGVARYADVARTQQVAESDYTYDGAARLTGINHHRGLQALSSYTWQYDAGNRVTQFVSSADGTVDYSYDLRDQVTAADYDYQTDESYSYDENGNRTSYSSPLTGGGQEGVVTGDLNRLLDDGTYTYQYDAEGNRTKRIDKTTGETEVYTWDHRNRLTTISTFDEDPDLPTAETLIKEVFQTYDVFNRWIGREVDSDGDSTIDLETFFVYDGNQIILQFDAGEAADLSHRYLWGPLTDQILADEVLTDLEQEGDVLWPFTDNLGTVRDLAEYDEAMDETAIVDHYVYDAFGNETDHAGSNDLLFKYTGRVFDAETGLQNNLNRWFDPAVGRWLSEDPIGFSAGDANVYRYVGNFATGAVDPSGLAGFGIAPRAYNRAAIGGGGSGDLRLRPDAPSDVPKDDRAALLAWARKFGVFDEVNAILKAADKAGTGYVLGKEAQISEDSSDFGMGGSCGEAAEAIWKEVLNQKLDRDFRDNFVTVALETETGWHRGERGTHNWVKITFWHSEGSKSFFIDNSLLGRDHVFQLDDADKFRRSGVYTPVPPKPLTSKEIQDLIDYANSINDNCGWGQPSIPSKKKSDDFWGNHYHF